jgi:hypothetical protein
MKLGREALPEDLAYEYYSCYLPPKGGLPRLS